jgi:tetratricopeptide (TPR) repeat protein
MSPRPFSIGGRRAGLALAAAALAAAGGIWLWRISAGPRLDRQAARYAVPEVARRARQAPPLLFVGLDGADWQLLDRYVAAGTMPELARLIREGRRGPLRTEQPPLSPLVWTTMMTGRGPLEHRVLDFTRFSPASGEREPASSADRRVPAVWNMLSAAGRSVAVFGLWATYPAEDVNGWIVSDRLFSFQHRGAAPTAGVVSPAAEDGWARSALSASEREVDLEALRAYLPALERSAYDAALDSPDPYAHPVSALRRILVETRVYDRLASEAWSRRSPDVLILYLQGTDAIGHVFAPYAPPREAWIAPADFERYSGVPELYFRAVDQLLGRYRELAEARGAGLMLASDHGFLWSEGRPRELSSMATATAGKWHREQGIYLLWGPSIEGAAAEEPGGVAQVASTLLALAGAPPGAGLAGPPLGGVRAAAEPVDYRTFYRAASEAESPPLESGEELAKLRALGYLGGAEGSAAPKGRGGTRTGGSFNNEGLILEAAGRGAEAIAAYEQALEQDPGLLSAAWNLSNLLFETGGDLDRADRLAVEAYGAGLPSGGPLLVGRARAYRERGQLARSVTLLDGALAVRSEDAELRLFRGRYRVEAGDCAGAADDFARASVARPRDAVALASLGMARLCLGDAAGGAAALRRSLALDPDQPAVKAALERLP